MQRFWFSRPAGSLVDFPINVSISEPSLTFFLLIKLQPWVVMYRPEVGIIHFSYAVLYTVQISNCHKFDVSL